MLRHRPGTPGNTHNPGFGNANGCSKYNMYLLCIGRLVVERTRQISNAPLFLRVKAVRVRSTFDLLNDAGTKSLPLGGDTIVVYFLEMVKRGHTPATIQTGGQGKHENTSSVCLCGRPVRAPTSNSMNYDALARRP